MRREPPVRIREGLGVQLPRATRLLLGFDGPRDEAEIIKDRIGEFLRDQLKLELSPDIPSANEIFLAEENTIDVYVG
jgi:hypothetical protein